MGKYLKYQIIIVVFYAQDLSADGNHDAADQNYLLPSVEIKVIEDLGGELIDPYLPKNHDTSDQKNQHAQLPHTNLLVDSRFPVVTRSMTVGRVSEEEGRAVNYPMATRPMFIIGYDPVSIQWLKSNRKLLDQKKAIGLVVNIQTKEQLAELQTLVGDRVMLQPTPGERLAEHLKIQHYPFYLDNQGVLR